MAVGTFVVDSMLGKLCRWLRMLGADAAYLRDATDVELLELSLEEKRVLLTRDEELYRRATARGIEAYFVEGEDEAEMLANLSRRFGIRLDLDVSISRCPACNSRIVAVPKEAVESRVPPTTYRAQEQFWRCPSCGKVYWQGSHWKGIRSVLKEAKRHLEERCRSS